jgi:hypothetical protein
MIAPSLYLAGCSFRIRASSTSAELENTMTIAGVYALYPMTIWWAEE